MAGADQESESGGDLARPKEQRGQFGFFKRNGRRSGKLTSQLALPSVASFAPSSLKRLLASGKRTMQTTNAASAKIVASAVTVEARMRTTGAAVQKEARSKMMARAEMAAAIGLRTRAWESLSGSASASARAKGLAGSAVWSACAGTSQGRTLGTEQRARHILEIVADTDVGTGVCNEPEGAQVSQPGHGALFTYPLTRTCDAEPKVAEEYLAAL